MRINNIKWVLILTLITIELTSVFLMYKSANNNETILDNVKMEEKNIKESHGIAVLLEQSDGTYKDSDTTTWPTNMIFNSSKSGCIDTKGTTIENAVSYANNLITITTNRTAYCYIYFDLDKVAPTITSMSLNSGATYVTSATVTANLSWSDNDVEYYCVTNTNNSSSCSWKAASGTSAQVSHTLSSGDGTKTVYAFIKDTTGNISSVVSDTIVLDTAAPTSQSVSIKDGAAYTNSTSVALTLSSSGATQMCISNTTSCTAWETYATSKTHTLTSGDGTKTVYVWYRDAAGNTTSVVSDTIVLDTAAPTSPSIQIKNGDATTNTTSVTLTLSASGATQMCISNTTSCTAWETYATSKTHTLTSGDGTKTVYVWYRDAAGNTSSVVSDTITLSTVVINVGVSVNDNSTYLATMTITTNYAGTYCVNTSAVASDMSNCLFTGSITTSGITTEYFPNYSQDTYYAHVTDGAGNYGVSSPLEVIACFTEETQVLYFDKKKKKKLKKKIKDIEAGDIVYSYDPKTDSYITTKVKAVHINKANKLFKLTFDDGNYVKVAENHLFFIKNVGYLHSQLLKVGYELQCPDCESRKIIDIEEIFLDEYVDLYVLELESGANFIVGLSGVIAAAIYTNVYLYIIKPDNVSAWGHF